MLFILTNKFNGEEIIWTECGRGVRSRDRNLPMTQNEADTFGSMLSSGTVETMTAQNSYRIEKAAPGNQKTS